MIRNRDAWEDGRARNIRLNANKGRRKRWLEADPTRAEIVTFLADFGHGMGESFLDKMAWNLTEWGHLTEKMEAAVRKIMTEREATMAKRAAEAEAAAPVPVSEARMMVEGEVLLTKVTDGPFGMVTKMLVKTPDGWKAWGTKPRWLEAERGDRVRFEAKVEPSKDDPKFAWFSRPTKAENLTPKTKEAA